MRQFASNLTSYLATPLLKFKRGLRLRHTILACVLVSILITELVVLGASYVIWSRDQIGGLYRDTLLMFRSNVDTTSFLSVDETIKMGQRITSFSNVRGGAIYNRIGEQIAGFGQQPGISMRSFQREGINYLETNDGASLDIFYPTAITGLANPVVLRLDISDIPAQLWARLEEKAAGTLSIAFVSALAIVLLLNLTVVRPIRRLRDAVLKATDNPNAADAARLNWQRNDEFGDVAKALDMLFTTVSIVYQEDLAAGQEARQQSAFAILTYDSAWRLMNANAAALNLFGVATQNDIFEKHECFIRQKNESGTHDVSPKALVQENFTGLANIITAGGLKRCIMNAVVVHKRTGAILRNVITLADITKFSSQIEALKSETAKLATDKKNQKRRLAEMRALFQSCLILLSTAGKSQTQESAEGENESAGQAPVSNAARPVTLTDRIVNAWFFEARANHLIDSKLTHDVLPPAYGTPEEVEAIFRQALMAVYSQAGEKPDIRIQAEKLEENKTRFVIWAEKPKHSSAQIKDDLHAAGAQLSIASLRHSLSALGGTLAEASAGRVSFIIETASFSDTRLLSDRQQAIEPGAENELKKILEL